MGLTVPGILRPVTGALLHELSSIPVIANSARLINRRATGPGQASRQAESSAARPATPPRPHRLHPRLPPPVTHRNP